MEFNTYTPTQKRFQWVSSLLRYSTHDEPNYVDCIYGAGRDGSSTLFEVANNAKD